MLNLLYKTIVQTNGQYFTKLQILHFTFILRMGKQGIFSLCGKKFVCHLKMAEHCESAIQLVLNVWFGVCGGGRQPKHKNHIFQFWEVPPRLQPSLVRIQPFPQMERIFPFLTFLTILIMEVESQCKISTITHFKICPLYSNICFCQVNSFALICLEETLP